MVNVDFPQKLSWKPPGNLGNLDVADVVMTEVEKRINEL